MNVTVTPAPRSTLAVRVEVPSEKLDAAILEAVRHLSQRTKIAGFRPGKAPRAVVERIVGAEAILEEAMDHVVQRAYRDAPMFGGVESGQARRSGFRRDGRRPS